MNTKQNFIIFSSILALAIAFIYQNTSFAQLGTDPRILTVRQGGTGTSTVTTGAVIYGNGTGAFLSIGPCSDGQPREWSSSLPTCGTDATGAGGDYPFTPQIIGGTEHSASTTRPFYFSQGLLTSSSTMGFLNVGFLNATSSTASTFTVAPIFSSLTGVLKGNGASALTIAVDGTDFSLITALTCSGTDKFSAVTADGTFTCTADSTGSGGGPVNPFDFITIGGTSHAASSTRPFYFGQGLLAASSTLGYLNVGYINATSSTASTFAGGVTITCTDCVTDANVADLAVGGDVTGTLSAIAVTDDSHAHTGATISGLDISGDTNLTAGIGITLTDDDLSIDTSQNIATLSNLTSNGFVKTGGGVGTLSVDTSTYLTTVDISANTNLAATFPIVLTGDTLSFGWAYPFIGNATSSVLTLSSAPIFSSLTGVLKGNGASALTVAADGTDFSLIDALTCTGTDKFSAVTADGTFTCTTDSTSAGAADPFTWATNFGTTSMATTSPLWLRGGAIFASSTATSTFEGGLQASVLRSTNGLNVTNGATFGGNVGIGTTDPLGGTNRLHVKGTGSTYVNIDGTGATENAGFRLSLDGINKWTIRNDGGAADNLVFGNSTLDPFFISFAGNVGIGTSSPGSALSIQSIANFQAPTSTMYANLVAPNIRATSTISTVGLTVTGGLTLPASSVTNAMLANSTITFGKGTCATGSGSTALGGTGTVSVTSNCTDAATVDSIEGASLLRSNASDNYTSGTLTFDAATTLSIAGTLNYTNSATSSFKGGILTSQGFSGFFGSFRNLELGDGTASSTLKFDTSDGGQITIATSTSGRDVVLGATVKTFWGVSIASTTIDLGAGFGRANAIIPIPAKHYGYSISHIQCSTWGGTNVVVDLGPDNSAGSNDITCTPTSTTTRQRITGSNVFTFGQGEFLRIISQSGTNNWVFITAVGTTTPQ